MNNMEIANLASQIEQLESSIQVLNRVGAFEFAKEANALQSVVQTLKTRLMNISIYYDPDQVYAAAEYVYNCNPHAQRRAVQVAIQELSTPVIQNEDAIRVLEREIMNTLKAGAKHNVQTFVKSIELCDPTIWDMDALVSSGSSGYTIVFLCEEYDAEERRLNLQIDVLVDPNIGEDDIPKMVKVDVNQL